MDQQEIVGLLLSITALASYINHKFVKLPKSIGLTLVTLFFTVIVTILGECFVDVNTIAAGFVDDLGFNEHFLHGMLSFLLFSGSLHINVTEMSKYKMEIIAFSTASVIISSLLIATLTFAMVGVLGIELPFYYCLAFGALISPTDAIAVLGVLKKARVPKALEMKIIGEALFNDGAGVILFFLALTLATGSKHSLSWLEVLILFLQQGVGGVVFGMLLGWMTALIIKGLEDPEVVIIFTLTLVTAGYSVATVVLKVSGPISMAVAGLMIGLSLKDRSVGKNNLRLVDQFWELIDALLNAVLFVLIGLEFMRINFDLYTTLAAIGAVLITNTSRLVSILIPVSLLAKTKEYPPGVLAIMTWAGLRGGIAIALALSVMGPYHDTIVSITYGVVLFSIMIQGLSMEHVIKRMMKA